MIAAFVSQAGARVACFFQGHKRGKRVTDATATVFNGDGAGVVHHVFQCPRCKDTWTRKVKAA